MFVLTVRDSPWPEFSIYNKVVFVDVPLLDGNLCTARMGLKMQESNNGKLFRACVVDKLDKREFVLMKCHICQEINTTVQAEFASSCSKRLAALLAEDK